MSVTLTSCKIYAALFAGWTDLSSDCIGGISASWGISGNTPNDRLADTGTLRFTLLDNDGSYTPGSATALSTWTKGTPIKLEMVYGGETYVRFYGAVDTIVPVPQSATNIVANVTVVDWMNYAAEHPILTPAIQTDKRADEAINLILASMPKQPNTKIMETGVSTFPSVFDVTRSKTVALSEFQKLVESELSYAYLRKEKNSGEQFIFENAYHRNGLLPPKVIDKVATDFLLMETGDKLLLESGSKILLNETEAVTLTAFRSIGIEHGKNMSNRITVTAYPRKIDVARVVLYSLPRPLEIGNGEEKTFTANYSDPVGGQSAGGYNMAAPVATTDYTVNTAEDGGGTDLTASATVNVTFGGNRAEVTIKNNSTSSGYITFFRLRGYGVYTYATIEYAAEDADSIEDYGYIERRFNQKYQGDLTNGSVIANSQLYLDRNPRTVLQGITFLATKNNENLSAFLQYDIGNVVSITEATIGMTGTYIIQNISFTVETLGIVWVSYGLVEHWGYLAGNLTPVTISLDGGGNPQAINYGYLPQLVQTSARSYAAWVYCISGSYYLAAPFADGGGVVLLVSSNHPVLYTNLYDANPGQWTTTAAHIAYNAWQHIVWTYDAWDIDAVPVVYINGASEAVTESSTPAGALNSEFGAEVVVGNWHTDTQDYSAKWNGDLKDIRIYNRILSAAEVTTLYNAGVPDTSLVTDGLVFQGPCLAKFEEDIAWTAVTTAEYTKFLENVYRASGTAIAP